MSRGAALGLALSALLLAWPALGGSRDAPEISRSVGVQGGVVVLWPRVIPATDAPVPRNAAWAVQRHLAQRVAEALPGRPVDIRPEPERVCPQAGCQGVAVGALVVHHNLGCAVVALVSRPGRSDQVLVPWAGDVQLKQPRVPFREPPESHITVRDFQRCDALGAPLQQRSSQVASALQAAFETQGPSPE